MWLPLLVIAVASCDPVRQFCNSNSDCATQSGQACDLSLSPPGECRNTCGATGQTCVATTSAPYPIGDNSSCAPDEQCRCNPVAAAFFCESQ